MFVGSGHSLRTEEPQSPNNVPVQIHAQQAPAQPQSPNDVPTRINTAPGTETSSGGERELSGLPERPVPQGLVQVQDMDRTLPAQAVDTSKIAIGCAVCFFALGAICWLLLNTIKADSLAKTTTLPPHIRLRS